MFILTWYGNSGKRITKQKAQLFRAAHRELLANKQDPDSERPGRRPI